LACFQYLEKTDATSSVQSSTLDANNRSSKIELNANDL
jgi:hypothetical protein